MENIENVKKLRKESGESLKNCNIALEVSNNDIDLAMMYLKDNAVGTKNFENSEKNLNNVYDYLDTLNQKHMFNNAIFITKKM